MIGADRVDKGGSKAPALWWINSRVAHVKSESTGMQYVRPFDPDKASDAGFPGFGAQVLSHLENALIMSSHIKKGGWGPGMHYHRSDQLYYLIEGLMNISWVPRYTTSARTCLHVHPATRATDQFRAMQRPSAVATAPLGQPDAQRDRSDHGNGKQNRSCHPTNLSMIRLVPAETGCSGAGWRCQYRSVRIVLMADSIIGNRPTTCFSTSLPWTSSLRYRPRRYSSAACRTAPM